MPVQTQENLRKEVARDAKPGATAVDRQALIDGLNQDLAGEYQAILMYVHYSAKLTGPYRRELRAMFQAEIADEQGHAQFLADKIVALGGEPATTVDAVAPADDSREMLEQARTAEEQAIANYETRIRQAESYGDIGLKVHLENHVVDETRHKEDIERILAGWNEQNRERVRNEDRWQDDGGQG
jgi:bacterioferritin